MGLFKAAIIVGGGAYAIKKISAHREQKKQSRAAFDQNMSSGQQQPYRDYPEQQHHQNQYYDEKHEKTRGLDGGAEQYPYYDYPTKQQQQQQYSAPPVAVHPHALEFVDRRGSSSPQYNQQQQQQQAQQPWRLSNSHNAPLPQAHAFYPPPSYHQNAYAPPVGGQRNVTSGYVEPDELSLSDPSEGQSAWDRKGRRESANMSATGAGALSPKEYLEKHLSK